MAKGLDVGTSFIVLASDSLEPISYTSDDKAEFISYKDFRDAFYVIKPTTPVATKMIEKGLQGKVFVKDTDGAFILIGQDAIDKAIERNESAKRPMYRGVVSPKEKEAKRVLAFILKEVAGKAAEPSRATLRGPSMKPRRCATLSWPTTTTPALGSRGALAW